MNYKKQVLLFNIFFLLALMLVSLTYKYVDSLNRFSFFRSINIVSEIEKDTASAIEIQKIFSDTKPTEKGIVVRNYLTDNTFINSSGDRNALSNFYKNLDALQNQKNKKIRIGYFGDSFIEGDLITRDLRQLLQDKFGGDGVGFVPVTSISAGFRQTITHSFSNNWNDINFKSGNRSSENLFLSGHTFYGASESWVSFSGVNQPHLDSFTQVKILYGASKNNHPVLNITVNGSSHTLPANELFNSGNIKLDKCKTVKIIPNTDNIPLYGFSFESESGIIVDNFSFRGISGVELDNFKENFLAALQKNHPYDLLIIHYGPNLLFKPDLVDFSWYKKKMNPVLKKIRSSFSETSILLVSTADKGYKYNGLWQTEKGVLPLIDTQYKLAAESKIDFFNLYNAMGGHNQMVKWVEAQPPLANKDYTHVNMRGAKKIAEILFIRIMNEFNEYKKLNN